MSFQFEKITKPTLLLNETTARRNLHRMVERARSAGVAFRPHFKTHQSAEIGEWFREEGVNAITVSSVDMAVYFAQHGWDDILIAFTANLRQSKMLSVLAETVKLSVLVESAEAVSGLSAVLTSPVDAWIKIDAGAHRTGVAWDQLASALKVAQAAAAAPNLRLRGLLTHAGHTYSAPDRLEICRRSAESAARLDHLRAALQECGTGRLLVSVGDTPSASVCDQFGPVDEIRPGNFIFYDVQQMLLGSCGWQDVAVAVACPVVARHPDRCEIVVYGGAVHLSKDFAIENNRRVYSYVCLPESGGWGAPLHGAYASALSQEHGIIHIPPADFERIQVGDLVCVLPSHSCLTVTLMKRYTTLSGRTIDTMNIL